MVRIVQSNANDFRRHYWRQGPDALEFSRLLIERRRAKYIPDQSENLSIHDFSVKNLFALLKAANSSHNVQLLLTNAR
jgi:hypothetical protein